MLYVNVGLSIYNHSMVKYFFMGIIVGFVSLSTGQWVDQMGYLMKLHDEIYDLGYAAVVFVVVVGVTVAVHLRRRWVVFEGGSVREKAGYLKGWVGDESEEGECYFRGLVLNHITMTC